MNDYTNNILYPFMILTINNLYSINKNNIYYNIYKL